VIRRFRIYISAPANKNLDQGQLSIKKAILKAIEKTKFEAQEFLQSGIPKRSPWSFDAANQVMTRCKGVAILSFARWYCTSSATSRDTVALPSEYNHFEGALAFSHNLPLLVITDQNIRTSGITLLSQVPVIYWPDNAGPEWIDSESFISQFAEWRDQVKSRPDVFLGYCSAARNTANEITLYLEHELELDVRNYAMDFRAGSTILEQIEEASHDCMCGIFLFTKDDQLEGAEVHAAPRDNVIFEAGYFIRARGKERVVVIREEGAKMPADIGGNVYILLKDRNDISGIKSDIRRFLESAL
jgi:CAP12/Pycsar effector protein, TIR domain